MLPELTAFFLKAKDVIDASPLSISSHVVSNLKGSPKVFVSVEEEREGVVLDLLKSSVSFEGRLRDGGFGAIFSFTEQGFFDFMSGKSLSQCVFENNLNTSGASENLFLASLYLDELSREIRNLNDTHSLH